MTAPSRRRQQDHLPSNRLTSAFERRIGRVLARATAVDVPLVVAASGGPDSTALLVACARVRTGAERVVAACFDHGMRPASETARDRAFVREVARAVGADVRVGAVRGSAPPRGEAAARKARYGWLARVCAEVGAQACVTGHTMDDQAETVLLRITRGAGVGGAAGMAALADWPVAGARPGRPLPHVVRPLLTVSRDEVLDYLDALELQPNEDETNAVVTFDRNRVRHRVMSELRRINPRATQQIARFAAQARSDDEALTLWAERELGAHAAWDDVSTRVARAALLGLPIGVSSRMLRLLARRVGLQLEYAHVEQLLALASRRGARAALPAGEAVTSGEWLEIRALPARRAAHGPRPGSGARSRTQ